MRILALTVSVGAFCFSVGAVESKISDIFPDANLAAEVAKQPGKSVDDVVTGDELATVEEIGALDRYGYTGESVEISTLAGVENLTGLKLLCVTGRELTSANEIADLVNLEILGIQSASLTQIPPLDNLANLKRLNLNDNRIGKIEGLDNLKELERLDLGDNQIGKIEGLNNLKELDWLDLGNNQIRKIEGLDNQKKLSGLVLDDNFITKVENVFHIADERTTQIIAGIDASISLSDNNISDISFLNSSYNDLAWNLDGNHIFDLSPLDEYFKNHLRYVFSIEKQKVVLPRILEPDVNNRIQFSDIVGSSKRYHLNYSSTINYDYDSETDTLFADVPIDENAGSFDYGRYFYSGQIDFGRNCFNYSITVTYRWMRGLSKYDMDNNGMVNVSDIVTLKNQIMAGTASLDHDIDGSGAVNVGDIIALKEFVMTF